MNRLTVEQKKYLIDIAKKSYLLAIDERKSNIDPFIILESRTHPLNESCYKISSLIYHIVKKEYGISDEDNKVYHCVIKFDEGTNAFAYSHYVNKVCGEYVDASIEQFNNKVNVFLSSYENYEQYYQEIEESKPLNLNGIEEEIEAYELLLLTQQLIKRDRYKK